jgi:hypothetical protein
MSGDRIMSSEHQNENATDNEARTNQTNPPPPRPLPDREEPARQPFKPLRPPKDSR